MCKSSRFVNCLRSSAHHLCKGGLDDSHHQALQADNLLHVEAHRRVADSVRVFWFLCHPLLCLHLVRAAVLSQADGRSTARVLQQMEDFSQTVSDEAVKKLGGHDGGSGPCVSIKHAPKVERDPGTVLKNK